MRSPREWQEIARVVTDPLPPLTDEQNRGLTRIAVQSIHGRSNERMSEAA